MPVTRFGLSVALATPFGGMGAIDTAKMIDLARRCLSQGCGSVTLFGTTGEGASVGGRERREVMTAMLGAGIAPRQLVAGVLVSAAADAADQAREALRLGVRNILLAPPSYFKGVSDNGIFGWFAAVFEAIGPDVRDILVYNIPSVTTVQLSIELIGRLRAAFPGAMAGVKDSGGDWSYSQALLGAHSDLVILIGDERHLAQSVPLGGQGAISGMANFATAEILAMVAGREDKRVEAFVAELLKRPVIPAVKAMVASRTGDPAWLAVRPPLVSVAQEEARAIEDVFDRLFGIREGLEAAHE